jgi:uncharacterized DUF497 family protein
MRDDNFEWDDVKADINWRRHRTSFRTGRRVFADYFALIEHDLSEDYGEDRFLATGMVDGRLVIVAYTEREERIRIISARKANRHEQRKYYRSQTTR